MKRIPRKLKKRYRNNILKKMNSIIRCYVIQKGKEKENERFVLKIKNDDLIEYGKKFDNKVRKCGNYRCEITL